MKRLRKRLVKEFERLSDKFKYRGMRVTNCYPHQITLYWACFHKGGRIIKYKNLEENSFEESYQDFNKVPLHILKKSINYFNKLHEKELLY